MVKSSLHPTPVPVSDLGRLPEVSVRAVRRQKQMGLHAQRRKGQNLPVGLACLLTGMRAIPAVPDDRPSPFIAISGCAKPVGLDVDADRKSQLEARAARR